MSGMKEVIRHRSPDSGRPYLHLQPILDALIETGNVFAYGDGFYLDKDGWRADLRYPIDFDLLLARFEFPKSVELQRSTDSILCRDTWIEIAGSGDLSKR
jgi:hypothetical protein